MEDFSVRLRLMVNSLSGLIWRRRIKKAAGLLLMALRDVGLGILPLGSGSSIGRGYIDGSELLIKRRNLK